MFPLFLFVLRALYGVFFSFQNFTVSQESVSASENVLVISPFLYLVTYHTRNSDVACIVLDYAYYKLIGMIKSAVLSVLVFLSLHNSTRAGFSKV